MLTEDTSLLPLRLKQLRQELGWSLEDVAQVIQASSKGVVSNWEATTGRRRVPELGVLVALARWYGVSLDYLVGIPGAERDSSLVQRGKAGLRERFPTEVRQLGLNKPGERFRLAVAIVQDMAPGAFFLDRIAAYLLLSSDRLATILETGELTEVALSRFAHMVDLPVDWFYVRAEAFRSNGTSP